VQSKKKIFLSCYAEWPYLCGCLWKLNDEDFSISDYIALIAELEGTWNEAAIAYFKEISRHVHGGNLEKARKKFLNRYPVSGLIFEMDLMNTKKQCCQFDL